MKKSLVLIFFLALFLNCKDDKGNSRILPNLPNKDQGDLILNHAEGFSIQDYSSHKILTIKKPWPEAKKNSKYLIASKNELAQMTFEKEAYDGIITDSITKIVVTSTTHIPALELLGMEHTLVGFPGTDYISSEKTRQRIDNGLVRELGKNEGLNTEVLLELQPDVVIGFGVDGINTSFETIKKAGIPVIYNGDWVESTPLAKAEWIKFFGALFNKETEADSIFKSIESNYLNAKKLANKAKSKPTILSGAMHKEVWYLPNGSSPEAQFLKDANLNYLWGDTSGNGSLALSFEVVLEKAQQADIWLSPSYYTSYQQLEEASKLYTNFDAFKNKSIFTFSTTTGAKGGVLYYELGTSRPDLVLKDLIKIGHPELLENYNPRFFKPLQ
ncbi:ABC transporter substrate-binding protein [Winogradskyella aquimaris]|uniref:ABC transporter substrate-binding protein n=1 Tax=Winogradskyella aquimaris TaxID=864074 RepID=A0ABU5EMT9_9FLAO|nr:ABC transporter substrate-binding protein [Winogradskyella aquimaris]MDY2587766.1 ABC transporter substrate-binding protein [Winogradskyella aquimaris]